MLELNSNKRNRESEVKILIRKEKGITLLALIITVVIMIILAAVTINVTLGDGGLVQQAQHAAERTRNAAETEQAEIDSLQQELANILAEDSEITPPEPGENNEIGGDTEEPEEPSNVSDLKPGDGESVTILDTTTTIKDDLQNDVVIPGGFGVAEDSGTKVEEGIVIEDENGNQFVWIPTGEYNVSTSINSSGKLTNNLSRRTFTTGGATEVSGDSVRESYFYGEGNSSSVASGQIGAFKASAESVVKGGKGGFYIGRYEQGSENVCKAGVEPYTNITRDNAKMQAEAMCSSNNNVESELISSYAWDTALNFICQTNVGSGEGYNLAVTTDKAYGGIDTRKKENTGAYEADNYSNIHDVLGNCREYTTEYRLSSNEPCTIRGGGYLQRK